VDATRDGAEGLWYATGAEYDVIILDLMLPNMPGLEILKKIRTRGNKAHVLILTAKDTVEDRVEGLDLGADDYLVKPFISSSHSHSKSYWLASAPFCVAATAERTQKSKSKTSKST